LSTEHIKAQTNENTTDSETLH